MKRAIIIVMVFVMVLSLGVVSVSAATNNNAIKEIPPDMELDWANVTSISLGISYSGTTATCSGLIRGISSVNSISATFTLRRVNANGTTTLVRTWSESSSTSSLNFSGSHSPVSKGETYRLEVSAVVTTTSGGRETVWDSVTRTY
jgi:hypothetical protein